MDAPTSAPARVTAPGQRGAQVVMFELELGVARGLVRAD